MNTAAMYNKIKKKGTGLEKLYSLAVSHMAPQRIKDRNPNAMAVMINVKTTLIPFFIISLFLIIH